MIVVEGSGNNESRCLDAMFGISLGGGTESFNRGYNHE